MLTEPLESGLGVKVSLKFTLAESVEASCSVPERLAGDCSSPAMPQGMGGLNWDPVSLRFSIACIVSSNTLLARPAQLGIFSPKAITFASSKCWFCAVIIFSSAEVLRPTYLSILALFSTLPVVLLVPSAKV